jgi:alanyl-tRNA synthetase
MLEVEARDLLQHAEPSRDRLVVRKTFSGRSLDSAKALALKLASHERVLAIIGLQQDPAQAVVARCNGMEGDCGAAVRKAAAEHGGRGGGRPELAQAGGIPAESLARWLAAIESFFKE